MLSLRPARQDDADILLQWRNDTETRANSLRGEVIDLLTHRAWLNGVQASGHSHLYVALEGDTPVGTGRLDRDRQDAAELSVTVAPEHRGRGVGQALIRALMEEAQRLGLHGLHATVKRTSTASLMAFLAVGFVVASQDSDGLMRLYWEAGPRRP